VNDKSTHSFARPAKRIYVKANAGTLCGFPPANSRASAGGGSRRYSVITLSAHSTRETKIVGFPYVAPYLLRSASVAPRAREQAPHYCFRVIILGVLTLSIYMKTLNRKMNATTHERTGVVMVTLSMTLIPTVTWIEESARHARESVN
jgi:hypothetical protein